MDLPLVIIGVLLIASLAAFFTGLLPYPIGWIILGAAFLAACRTFPASCRYNCASVLE